MCASRKERVLLYSASDAQAGEMLKEHLKHYYTLIAVEDKDEILQEVKISSPDLVLIYLEKDPGSEYYMDLIQDIINTDEDMSVLMVVAQGDVQSMVRVAETGAFYYWTGLPLDIESVRQLIEVKLEIRRKSVTIGVSEPSPFGIVGKSGAIRRTLALVEKLKDNHANVLITGESGTGKELIAHALHYGGTRKEGPFEVVNCGALPANLVESELFGYVRGAFTGAYHDRKGKFEMANKGTLFLDEIGEIELPLQAKLLRVLEDQTVSPLGSTHSVKVDVRIVAATNRDLEKMVRDGLFREDLFFRLNVITIHLPPLRERRQDIPLLVETFIDKYAREYSRDIEGIEDSALELLKEYSYPGNIRELQNIIQRAVILTDSRFIRVADLPPVVIKSAGPTPSVSDEKPEKKIPVYVGESLAEVEKKLILATLEYYRNNKMRAAQVLGITDRTLRNKLKEYGEQ